MSDSRTNRLASETSPYLLQHATNPVDWYPWGPEALARARDENKPIFLSVGYSACHWCHVMERESFANARIATVMNESFVNVKVDREERPDVDELYMRAVQAMTGQGGWPMSVFLTPDQEPFFGGTYFPPESRFGRTGFLEVLRSIAERWSADPESLRSQGERLRDAISRDTATSLVGELPPDVLDRAFLALRERYDETWGGFGDAPKFPHALDLRLCLRHWRRSGDPLARKIVRTSLDRMSEGGVYDQLGGGFHRYSTDEMWLVPHFEKMLYDNALLVPAYLEAHLAFGGESGRYGRIAAECCDWILREMTTPEGGFASSQDADTDGEEGAYFSWTQEELDAVLGHPLGIWAGEWFGVTLEGSFEHGRSVLWRHDEAADVALRLSLDDPRELIDAMEGARARLLEVRETRTRPSTDDKVLAGWNGLAISALAQAWQVLGDERYLEAARRAARFVTTTMRQADGRLFATARGGEARLNAYLSDYTFVIAGLVDLYESDFDESWLREALALAEVVEEEFLDRDSGGYFTTGRSHEELLSRLRDLHDGALPAASGVHASNLVRLAELTGDARHASMAESCIRAVGSLVTRHPAAFSQLLLAVDHLAAGGVEIVVAGEPDDEAVQSLLAEVRGTFLPHRVVALAREGSDESLLALLAGRGPENGVRAFVCRNYSCDAPVTSPDELRAKLEEAGRPGR